MATKPVKFNVGGEAVIEGVMMRAPHYYAIAVRRASGSMVTTSGAVNSAADRFKFLKWPVLRGVLSMYESMSLGFKALTWSANILDEDIRLDEAKKKNVKVKDLKPRNEVLENAISFTIAIILAVGLFIMLPYALNRLLAKQFADVNTNRYLFNTGMVVFKMAIFLLYVWSISLMNDVKRLFQYHGAEHKCIYTYEDGKPLVYKNIKPYSTRHPRCGTAFIIITLIVSLFIFVLCLPAELKLWQRILWEIPLLIPIVGLSYEALKLSDKYRDNPLVKILIAPGLAFQLLTTKEPDEKMVATAVASLKLAVKLENAYLKKTASKKAKRG
ncbi:MAG: DUF1385 domain-containing protein [Spirochaetia bacterium]|nr:DUF1385 domain-containing protein [Spirochaetia bacterium]